VVDNFQKADADSSVSVVILRGDGRAFSVGTDIELNYPKSKPNAMTRCAGTSSYMA
jgi:enoyl-CoA hydratase/carnithine racemase